jgi:bacteriocin-like protein
MKNLKKMGLKEHSTLSNKQMKQVIGGYAINCVGWNGASCGDGATCMRRTGGMGICGISNGEENFQGCGCLYSPNVA